MQTYDALVNEFWEFIGTSTSNQLTAKELVDMLEKFKNHKEVARDFSKKVCLADVTKGIRDKRSDGSVA